MRTPDRLGVNGSINSTQKRQKILVEKRTIEHVMECTATVLLHGKN
jgi:hypothetical protein